MSFNWNIWLLWTHFFYFWFVVVISLKALKWWVIDLVWCFKMFCSHRQIAEQSFIPIIKVLYHGITCINIRTISIYSHFVEQSDIYIVRFQMEYTINQLFNLFEDLNWIHFCFMCLPHNEQFDISCCFIFIFVAILLYTRYSLQTWYDRVLN